MHTHKEIKSCTRLNIQLRKLSPFGEFVPLNQQRRDGIHFKKKINKINSIWPKWHVSADYQTLATSKILI